MTATLRAVPLAALAVISFLALAGCSRLSGPERLAEVHIYAAQSYLQDRQVGKAYDEIQKALELAPDYPKSHVLLGAIYDAQGKGEQAIAEYRWVTEREPENARAWQFWGGVLLRKGQHAEAVAKLARAAELEPSTAPIQTSLAISLSGAGRHADAVAVFERLGQDEADLTIDAFAAWGVSLIALGRPAEARARFEEGIARDPENVALMTRLGVLLEGSADPADRTRKLELYEAVLRIRPDDPAALHNLGRAYLEIDRAEEAHSLIQRSLAATDPGDPLFDTRRTNLQRAEERLPRATAGPNMPNVLLIVLDTLRADHLGAYGYERRTSPHLDSLAKAGVVLENAISQAPWTAPSVASVFTSLYPSVHGLDGGVRWGPGQRGAGGSLPFALQKALRPGQLTLAEMLRRHGYQTAGFVSNVYVNSIFGFSQGFQTYRDDHGDYSENVGGAKRRAHETNAHVFEWLESQPREPFFLFVHYNDCHWPYDPPAPYGAEWVADYRGELTPAKTTAVVEQHGRPITNLGPEDVRYLVGLYDGEIAYLDAQVGKLLEKIAVTGLDRKLLTVVLADHGEEFLDHGSASHGYTLYEEQIRVPLIFHYPGRLAPRRVPAQVRLIDVLPSVLELAGIANVPDSFQGESVANLLLGKSKEGPREAYSEATYVNDRKSLRTSERLKLIDETKTGEMTLFDLSRDPREQTDLADRRSSDAAKLRARLQGWSEANSSLRETLYAGKPEQHEVVLDDEAQRQLRALGYIE